MGNYSWLTATRNQPENCEIGWNAMDTNLLYKEWLLEECHKETADKRPLNLDQMANRWHDTKFCGYWDQDYIVALQEFCKHLKPYGSHPRLYYDYEGFDQLWCLEFIPGTDIIHWAAYSYYEDMKAGPEYPKELEECESYTDEIAMIEEEYSERHNAYRESILKQLPDRDGWKFQRLVHRPMSDAEALMSFYRMIHPS